MKKISLILAIATVFAFTAEAQTDKQVAGTKSFEVQFNPFGGTGRAVDLNGGIKFRSFSSDTKAIRATVSLNAQQMTDKRIETDNTGSDIDVKDKMTTTGIYIRPGMEWHLAGTDKLSPYYGAEAIIGFSSSSNVTESYVIDKIEENTTKMSTTSVGINAIGGVDYYFAQNIFLGVEIGAGIVYDIQGANKSSSTIEGSEDSETPGGSTLTGGPTVNPSMRLGIIF